MKLNTDILYDRLREIYPVEMYGRDSGALSLLRPELYIDNTNRFLEDHVYLATVEHLPHRPFIEKNAVVICIGEGSVLTYYKQHAVVLMIRKKVDFYEAYQTVQRIYDTFARWESDALALFLGTPSVEDVLRCASGVLNGPVCVLDSAFQFIAAAPGPEKSDFSIPEVRGALDPQAFVSFLREKDVSMDIHGAFVLDMTEGKVLCVNLFSPEDEYIGCLYIQRTDRNGAPGEAALAEMLAQMVEKAIAVNPALINDEMGTLREILRLTMNERPLMRSQKLLLRSKNYTTPYRCASVHYTKAFSSLPAGYVCSVLEGIVPGSVFFEYQNTLFGLIPETAIAPEGRQNGDALRPLNDMIREMHLCMGVSNGFRDLYMLRTFYLQAEAAIENGRLLGEEKSIYHFADYALTEMITNALGGLPAEVYFPGGMRELLEHDKAGGISYLETLKVLLEENMSLSRASRRLYIHRSTLVERISRIEKELVLDLNDPDQRLQIQILLKVLALEEQAKNQ